jgi:hypothetical protein
VHRGRLLTTSAGSSLRRGAQALSLSLVWAAAGCADETLSNLAAGEPVKEHHFVDLTVRGYCAEPGRSYQTFYVANLSARIKGGLLRADYDRDGIPNFLDADPVYNVSVEHADTDQNGYGDLLVTLAGLDRENQARLKRCELTTQDSDQDGLTDCEEDNLLHTDPKAVDSDGDSVPDYAEIRGGMNPLDAYDSVQDLDGDGIAGGDELRLGTPPDEFNTEAITALAIAYEAVPLGGEALGCVDFFAKNVPLAQVDNGNLIRLYVIERTAEALTLQRNFRVVLPTSEPSGAALEYDLTEMEEGI